MDWRIAVLTSVVLLLLTASSVAAYDVVGDYVIEDNNKIRIYTWPHTMKFSEQEVWTCLTSKIYEGGIDVALGFDTDAAIPTGLWYNDKPVSKDKFDRVDRDYLGSDRWFVFRNFTVAEDQEYCFKTRIKILSPGSGKYNICMKPTDLSLQDAIADNKFFCLDPWWNASYLHRHVLYGNISTNSGNVTVLGTINVTLGDTGSYEIFHCPIMVPNSATQQVMGYVYYNDHTDYVCANYTDTDQEYLVVDTGNGTDSGSPDSSLVAWQLMSQCSDSTCVDRSIYSGDYTITKTTTNTTNITGHIGMAQNFTGIRDQGFYYDDADHIDLHCGTVPGYTIMAWVKPHPEKEAYQALWDKGNNQYVTYIGANEQITGYMWYGPNDADVPNTANSVITYGVWQHIAATTNCTDDGTMYYIDGEIEPITSYGHSAGARGTTGQLRLGYNYGTTALNGGMDEFRIYNRTLSLDEIRAIYRSQAGYFNYTLNETEQNVTEISIDSPDNTTYTHNSSIPLTWQFTSDHGYTCVSSFYSLNGGANTSTLCLNISGIVPSYGSNTLTMWVTDSNGSLHTDTVSFTNLYADYDSVCVYDEMTESEINGSGFLFQVFCPDETINYTLSDHCYTGINFTCEFEELRLTGTWGSDTIWRTLIPEVYAGNTSFYLYNATAEDSVEVNLFVQDLTGEYSGGIIHLTKVLSNGSTAMVDQIIDAESKVVIYYIDGEKYHLTIEDADGNIRDLGDLTADSSTSKTITVSDIALVPTRTLNGLGWLFGGNIGELNLTFRDSRSITVIVTYSVYNASNTSLPLLYADTCIDEDCFFNYTTPNNTTEYKACFEALTNRGYTYHACEIYSSRTWTIAWFEPNPILYAIVASLVALMIIAASSAVHIKFGLIGASAWMIFINTRGWFSALTFDPNALTGIFAFAMAVSVIYAILEGGKPT